MTPCVIIGVLSARKQALNLVFAGRTVIAFYFVGRGSAALTTNVV